jgi:phosphoglycolate phosphatase-like HAD superfamily hydrolase
MEMLGVRHAWMVGDMPDDVRAARSAGVIPLGALAPSDHSVDASAALLSSGAARVLTSLDGILELLA